MIAYMFVSSVGILLIIIGFLFLFRQLLRSRVVVPLLLLIVGFLILFEGPHTVKTFGPGISPEFSLKDRFNLFFKEDELPQLADIARDPNDVPRPLQLAQPTTVKINLEAKEVIAEIAPGITLNYWTFNEQVPGPFLRVREGDSVELTLKNNSANLYHHSVDLHAVTGPGGGAAVTNVAPGESKTVTFKALNPGLYVYHCAHPNAAVHVTHGMYGLILVEPKDGLPKVDRELYIMQGELYTTGILGEKGFQNFDPEKMLATQPEYIVFNGKVGGVHEKVRARVGEKIRIFFGNGGVNFSSSFHVIGEIFDMVYPEGAIGSPPNRNIQTTSVPAGGATIVEFQTQVPGSYTLVDHTLARIDRGAWGTLTVEGQNNPNIFNGNFDVSDHAAGGHGH